VNITLKKITVSLRLSQETVAFAADVWVDGKRVGTATNSGTGGATLVQISPPELRQRVTAYGATRVPTEYSAFTDGAEWLVDQLVEAHLKAKDEAKFAKIDQRECAALAKMGLAAARFQDANGWRWFGYQRGADPMAAAKQVAAQHHVTVQELKCLP
jgi:hypothetical protein